MFRLHSCHKTKAFVDHMNKTAVLSKNENINRKNLPTFVSVESLLSYLPGLTKIRPHKKSTCHLPTFVSVESLLSYLPGLTKINLSFEVYG